jgi:hypothetical protein
LLPDTEFRIEELTYEEAKPEKDRGIFALLRGGLRAVSGALGHRTRSAYQLRTPVATIGIRGTAYELQCQGACQSMTPTADPTADGMLIRVTDGEISLGDTGTVAVGEAVWLNRQGLNPQPLTGEMLNLPNVAATISQVAAAATEVPAGIDIPVSSAAAPPGAGTLAVVVYHGDVDIEAGSSTTALTAGQGGVVGPSGPAQIVEPPVFMVEDPGLNPDLVGEGGGPKGCFIK